MTVTKSVIFVKIDGVQGSDTVSFRGCIQDWHLVSQDSTVEPDYGHESAFLRGVNPGGCGFV